MEILLEELTELFAKDKKTWEEEELYFSGLDDSLEDTKLCDGRITEKPMTIEEIKKWLNGDFNKLKEIEKVLKKFKDSYLSGSALYVDIQEILKK